MSMIFKFRMLSDEAEDFVRDYEVPYDMNLADFHAYLRESVGYSPAEMASIFTSDAEWEKLREFTSVDMGLEAEDDSFSVPLPMERVSLGQIMHEKFGRLVYVFDIFHERQFFIELLETKFAEEGVTYPRIVTEEGEPPLQCTPGKEPAEGSIFDEAMDEFGEFEGDDTYDDEQ
ncbi:MAG: plasmid pRiA4b ORF-3 family protein [Rikenellaceae bacterium]|nr:plasmid pRiA4b ORF-3 family protein [Rikenellaceae bacterium]